MALIHLQLTYQPDTDRVKADLLVNGAREDGKDLTNTEMDGLSDHIDFTLPSQTLNARDVYRWITEECWFDTNGEPTNLELLLEEYVADRLGS